MALSRSRSRGRVDPAMRARQLRRFHKHLQDSCPDREDLSRFFNRAAIQQLDAFIGDEEWATPAVEELPWEENWLKKPKALSTQLQHMTRWYNDRFAEDAPESDKAAAVRSPTEITIASPPARAQEAESSNTHGVPRDVLTQGVLHVRDSLREDPGAGQTGQPHVATVVQPSAARPSAFSIAPSKETVAFGQSWTPHGTNAPRRVVDSSSPSMKENLLSNASRLPHLPFAPSTPSTQVNNFASPSDALPHHPGAFHTDRSRSQSAPITTFPSKDMDIQERALLNQHQDLVAGQGQGSTSLQPQPPPQEYSAVETTERSQDEKALDLSRMRVEMADIARAYESIEPEFLSSLEATRATSVAHRALDLRKLEYEAARRETSNRKTLMEARKLDAQLAKRALAGLGEALFVAGDAVRLNNERSNTRRAWREARDAWLRALELEHAAYKSVNKAFNELQTAEGVEETALREWNRVREGRVRVR